MRPFMQLLFRIRRGLLRVLRWPTRGVKVLVFDPAGAVLLVRHSYGDSDAFLLPGGGVHRRERPIDAAAREVREETGLQVRALAARSVHNSLHEGRRDTVYLFTAVADAVPEPDGVEVVEASFFPLEALPATVSAATLRRLAEYRGERSVDAEW